MQKFFFPAAKLAKKNPNEMKLHSNSHITY